MQIPQQRKAEVNTNEDVITKGGSRCQKYGRNGRDPFAVIPQMTAIVGISVLPSADRPSSGQTDNNVQQSRRVHCAGDAKLERQRPQPTDGLVDGNEANTMD